jgi:hypothetical protein
MMKASCLISAIYMLVACGSFGAFTVLVVDLIGNASDQLLAVAVTFESGDASYLWRLNPAA